MALISKRLSRFKPSLTVKISQKAREMSKNGFKVISLSSGEPDFDTPEHIKQYAKEAIDNGSNFLVIGRPITASTDITSSLQAIYDSIS